MESSGLLIDLAVALTAGLVGALLATLLRQSTIVGFIVAGIAIGPHTPGLSGDIATVEELANIGLVSLPACTSRSASSGRWAESPCWTAARRSSSWSPRG